MRVNKSVANERKKVVGERQFKKRECEVCKNSESFQTAQETEREKELKSGGIRETYKVN